MACKKNAAAIEAIERKICPSMKTEDLNMILNVLTSQNITPKQFAGIITFYKTMDKKNQKRMDDFINHVTNIDVTTNIPAE